MVHWPSLETETLRNRTESSTQLTELQIKTHTPNTNSAYFLKFSHPLCENKRQSLNFGTSKFLRRRITPVIVRCFVDWTWKNKNKWYNSLNYCVFWHIHNLKNMAASHTIQPDGSHAVRGLRVGDTRFRGTWMCSRTFHFYGRLHPCAARINL
jgi:hypothetical protein